MQFCCGDRLGNHADSVVSVRFDPRHAGLSDIPNVPAPGFPMRHNLPVSGAPQSVRECFVGAMS